MRHIRAVFGVFLLIFAILLAAPAAAQTPASPSGVTVEAAIEAYFSPDSDAEAAKLIRAANLDYKRVLIAHRLPSDVALLAEVELSRGAVALRYPLRLEDISSARDGSSWRVDWAPEAVYARALVDLVGADALARSDAGQPWTEIQRLPAFPVIVGADFYATPFGRIDAAASDAFQPPPDLHKYAQRWTGMLLQDDSGSANVDIILGAGVSWKRATEALLPAAMVGLARIYFVSMRDSVPVAFAAIAPVFGEMLAKDSLRMIAVSAMPASDPPGDAPRFGVRLRVGARALEAAADAQPNCSGEATFCMTSAEDFGAQLRALASQMQPAANAPSHVMLAANANVPAEWMLHLLAQTREILELPMGKIVVGYIGAQE